MSFCDFRLKKVHNCSCLNIIDELYSTYQVYVNLFGSLTANDTNTFNLRVPPFNIERYQQIWHF